MKKFILLTTLCTSIFFMSGCKETNEVNPEKVSTITENETLPLKERIEVEMQKDTNSIQNIVQGQFDDREIGFIKVLDKYGDKTINYSLTNELQSELLEYIKSISVKYEAQDGAYWGNSFDFIIIRPQYSTYQAGAHVGIILDKKELHITGGESVLPSIYKVKEDEDHVFEQLEKFFNLATE